MNSESENVVPFEASAPGAAPTSSRAVPPAAAAGVPDPGEAFVTKPGEEIYFYDEETSKYVRKNEAGTWVTLSEGQFMRHLKKDRGIRDKPVQGKIISPAHELLSEIENNRRVAFTGVIAGYPAGVHQVAGRRVLVTEDPVWIEPRQGEWPILHKFFEGMFLGEEPIDEAGKTKTIDQRPYVFAWMQHALQCFHEGRRASGLALCIAGEPNCGKSMFALILRWLFGDRVAKPYSAMIGQDDFNRDLVEAVLQLVDDENQADTRLEARLKFGGEIKKVVANNEFRLRAMHRDGFAIEVLRRLVVLVNLQLSRLMVLPPLDGDFNDKALICKGYARARPAELIDMDTPYEAACWPSPMPTRTEVEKEAYRAAIKAELPAFAWWLLQEFKMPSHVSGGRFVVRHWHHPAIAAELSQLSPHLRIWELILRSKCVLHERKGSADPESMVETVWKTEWKGSAGDLEMALKGTASQLTLDERREIPKSSWLGQRLADFKEHFGETVAKDTRTSKGRMWILHPRKEDLEGS